MPVFKEFGLYNDWGLFVVVIGILITAALLKSKGNFQSFRNALPAGLAAAGITLIATGLIWDSSIQTASVNTQPNPVELNAIVRLVPIEPQIATDPQLDTVTPKQSILDNQTVSAISQNHRERDSNQTAAIAPVNTPEPAELVKPEAMVKTEPVAVPAENTEPELVIHSSNLPEKSNLVIEIIPAAMHKSMPQPQAVIPDPGTVKTVRISAPAHSVTSTFAPETICYSSNTGTLYKPISSIPVNWNSRRLRQYDHLFKHYTRKYFGDQADWRWFKVQAFVESNLDRHAVSSAGAVGIMQILPATFRQIQKMNRFFRGKSLNDAEWNIAAGIYYSKYLLDEWSARAAPYKRLQLMFASYNAGLGRVSRTLSSYQLEEDDVLRNIGNLPKETRHYLRKISHFMREYRGISFVSPEHHCDITTDFSPLMVATNSW